MEKTAELAVDFDTVVAHLKMIVLGFFDVARKDDMLLSPIITGKSYAIVDPITNEIMGHVIMHGHQKKNGMDTEESQGDNLSAESKTDVLVAQAFHLSRDFEEKKEYNVCPFIE